MKVDLLTHISNMLSQKRLAIVFDFDETLILASDMDALLKKIRSLQGIRYAHNMTVF